MNGPTICGQIGVFQESRHVWVLCNINILNHYCYCKIVSFYVALHLIWGFGQKQWCSFFYGTTLDLRLWAIAMMFLLIWYYTWSEALGNSNDVPFNLVLHLIWGFGQCAMMFLFIWYYNWSEALGNVQWCFSLSGTTIDLRLWAMCNDVSLFLWLLCLCWGYGHVQWWFSFPMITMLVLRLWTCAMMFLFSYDYYACAEDMDMCN